MTCTSNNNLVVILLTEDSHWWQAESAQFPNIVQKNNKLNTSFLTQEASNSSYIFPHATKKEEKDYFVKMKKDVLKYNIIITLIYDSSNRISWNYHYTLLIRELVDNPFWVKKKIKWG